MADIIFDVDSTVLSVESLEVIMEASFAKDLKLEQKIQELTRQGMSGALSFSQSLEKRLALAQITQTQILAFCKNIKKYIDPQMDTLIQKLQKHHQIWLVSGAFDPVVLALGNTLGIDKKYCHGVRYTTRENDTIHIPQEGFGISKVHGVKQLEDKWHSPSILIGDGYTDYQLYESKLVDHFIVFTKHQSRQEVMKLHPIHALDVQSLETTLRQILA